MSENDYSQFLGRSTRNRIYPQITRIIYLLLVITVGQIGLTDDVPPHSTVVKVGVCNYKSKSDLLEDAPQDVIRRNVEYYLLSIQNAKSERVQLIIFPEGGLTTLVPFFEKGEAFIKYSLTISDWENICPCNDERWSAKGKKGEAIFKLSCAAKSNQMHVVVNILEREKEREGESPAYRIYNTNLVFNDSGHIIVRYRKIIPEERLNNVDVNDTSNNNIFHINNNTFKTIIGNDIYENYEFNSKFTLVWSTASMKGIKEGIKEIPPVFWAELLREQHKNIFISDYGDDKCTSSCLSFEGSLYTSFGELSDDKLIFAPPDNIKKYERRKELKANCSIQNLWEVNENVSWDKNDHKAQRLGNFEHKYNTKELKLNCPPIQNPQEHNVNMPCYIYNKLANQENFKEFFTTMPRMENTGFEVSLCGVTVRKNEINNPRSANITITWRSYACDQFLPITMDSLYWPLTNDTYNYILLGKSIVQLHLLNETNVTIFSLMRIRKMCCADNEDIPKTESDSRNNDSKVYTAGVYTVGMIIIIIIIIGIGIIIIIIGINFFVFCFRKKSKKTRYMKTST